MRYRTVDWCNFYFDRNGKGKGKYLAHVDIQASQTNAIYLTVNINLVILGPRQAKSTFEHALDIVRIQIILHTRKVSSGHWLSIETFYSIQWFCLRTAKALIRLPRCADWSGPSLFVYARKHVFAGFGLFTAEQRGLANSVDPDQVSQNAASDQGLHCLPLNYKLIHAVIKYTFLYQMHISLFCDGSWVGDFYGPVNTAKVMLVNVHTGPLTD